MPEVDDLLRQRVARDIAGTGAGPPIAELRIRALRRRRGKLAGLAAAGTVAAALVAVGAATMLNGEPAPSQPAAAAPSGTRFPLPDKIPMQGLDAGAEGILRFTDTDCPYLEGPTGGVIALNIAAGEAFGVRESDGTRRIIGVDGRHWGTEGEYTDFGGGGPANRNEFIDCGAPRTGRPFYHRFVVDYHGSVIEPPASSPSAN